MPSVRPASHSLLTRRFDSPDVALARIDEELATLKETIRALHAFRNTFTPAYTLPPELLTRIFSFVREMSTKDMQGRYFRNPRTGPLSWVGVTHVSQRWRDVAVSSPSLWTHLSSAYPQPIVDEWLKRSKSAPLSIYLNHTAQENADIVMGSSLFRIRDLTLSLYSASWYSVLPQLFSAAPLLESLSVTVTPLHTAPSSPAISDIMFEGTAPRLQRLELSGCSVDIASSMFTDLTILKIHNPPQKISATDMVTAIHNFPRLTALDLSSVLQEDTAAVSSNIGIINLYSLESVELRGHSLIQDLDILSHISFPMTSSLKLSTQTASGNAATTLTQFLRVHKSSRLPPSTPLNKAYHLCLDVEWNNLKVEFGSDYGSGLTLSDILRFEITGPWHDNLHIPETSDLAFLLQTLPLSNLTSLVNNFDLDIKMWVNVFGHLPKLQRISTSGIDAINLFWAIIKDFEETCPPSYVKKKTSSKRKGSKGKGCRGRNRKGTSQNAGSSTGSTVWEPVFSKLESIAIQDSPFPEKQHMDDLISALRARKSVHKGLKALDIMGCKNAENSLEA